MTRLLSRQELRIVELMGQGLEVKSRCRGIDSSGIHSASASRKYQAGS